jgi:hypothetical protein
MLKSSVGKLEAKDHERLLLLSEKAQLTESDRKELITL